MQAVALSRAMPLVFALMAAVSPPVGAQPSSRDQIEKGRYLVVYGGCNDCHTPKVMGPKGPSLNEALLLSGHPAGDPTPALPAGVLGPTGWGAVTTGGLTAWAGPWGISYAANLTPDKETGLGNWTYAQFRDTMRTGKHLGGGRDVLPPMPWMSVAALTEPDMKALFAYLKSVKPISNKVPNPLPPK